ncbi:MAG: ABC transporter permease [Chloroflexi bacterium]|nr:ABC transporter permease [Chloroflexota bacterium]
MNTLFFQYALAVRYLLGRKLRTGLTTLAIVFGVTVFFGLGMLTPAMSEAFRQNLIMSAGEVDLTVTHVTGGSFGAAALDVVRRTDGVAHATGMLRRNILLPAGLGRASGTKQEVTAVGVVGLDPATARTVRSLSLTTGRFLSDDDTSTMVIPVGLASKLALGVGDTFALPSSSGTAAFKVVGILSARPAAGVEEVCVPLSSAQALINQPGQINVVEALLAPGARRDSVAAAVQARLGDGFRLGGLEAGGEVQAAIKFGQTFYGLFGLMALLTGAFIIHNTFRSVVVERRHDLGMLRAVGASRRTVLGLTLAEALTQGVAGTALGLAAGYVLAALIMAAVTPLARDYLRVDIGRPLVPTVPNVVASVVLGVGIPVAGALLPAFSAARVSPLEALRPAADSSATRAAGRRALAGVALIVVAALTLVSGQFALSSLGTALFLVGLILIAPAAVRPIASTFGRLLGLLLAQEGQIAQGNLAREPGRAAITASTMMVGLAIAIALLGTLSSVLGGYRGYLDRSLGAHFLVMPSSLVLSGGNVGAGPDLAQRLRETPGVGALTTLRLASSEAQGIQLQLIGIDPGSYPLVSGLTFSQGDPAQAYAAIGRERAIILNGILATQLRAKVGDVLTLRTPEGDLPYQVVGVGLDYLNSKLTTGYISQAYLANDFHETSDVLLMVNAAPGANVAAVGGALERVVRDYPAFSLLDSESFRASQAEMLANFQRASYALLLAIAIPGLVAMVNTLAINVVERTREIGTLRAVGTTRRQVQRMILGESVLLAATGTAFGILAGLWLSYVFVAGMRATGFILAYDFPWAGVLACVAVGLLIGVLAAMLPARQAAQLPIVAALRYE